MRFFVLLLLIAGTGLAVRYLLPKLYPDGNYQGDPITVTWTEFVLGLVVMSILFLVIINPVGTNMARGNSLKYKEFWNGYETAANHSTIPCGRDGQCAFHYNCDPYEVTIHHPATYDSKGNITSPAYDTTETHYHHCPYATEEWVDTVDTTLGSYQISHGFSDHPQEWRGGSGIPGAVQQGHTFFWVEAGNRIRAGVPGGMTVRKTYDNYILASQYSILKKWSGAIEQYQAKRLMPKPVTSIDGFYYANKVYFVGGMFPHFTYGDWRFAINKLNGALGSDLQGDLHLVIADTADVKNPDEFSQALFAYWQSPKLGRDAASKNTIIVVVGTDGKTVKWSRADTGMPLGNEQLLTDLRNNLVGTALTPDALIGNPRIKGDHKVERGEGALENILWGPHKFDRVCMTCKDEKGKTGFQYLKGQIPLSGGQKWAIGFVTFFISLLIWGVMCVVDLHIPDVLEFEVPRLRRNR